MNGKLVAVVVIPLAILMGVSVAGMALLRTADAGSVRTLAAELVLGPADGTFDPASLDGLPEPARRYLTAAIAPGTPLARSVRLDMEGRMRLQGEWFPMRATETLGADGFVWDAGIERAGTDIRVWDSLGPDGGHTRVWLLWLVPAVRSGGDDVSRSAAERAAAERIWLPTALLPEAGVRWEAVGPDTARAHIPVGDLEVAVNLQVDAAGHVTALWLERWGDPGRSGTFRRMPFGGETSEPRSFGGITLPTHVRVGWGYGTDQYAPFFDVTVTGADVSGRT